MIRPKPAEVARRLRGQFSRAKKAAYHKIGVHWFRYLRPKHFTHEGFREYGYTPRKGQELPRGSREFWKSYCGRKLRLHGHMLPLVFTGESRGLSRTANVRATSKGVRVVMAAVRKLNWRHPESQVYAAAELRRVSDGEARELTRIFGFELNRRLSEAK